MKKVKIALLIAVLLAVVVTTVAYATSWSHAHEWVFKRDGTAIGGLKIVVVADWIPDWVKIVSASCTRIQYFDQWGYTVSVPVKSGCGASGYAQEKKQQLDALIVPPDGSLPTYDVMGKCREFQSEPGQFYCSSTQSIVP